MPSAILVQLARLGDLVQSLPVITALRSLYPDQPLDLLCAPPLVPLGKLFPGISMVYPWSGDGFQQSRNDPILNWTEQFKRIEHEWRVRGYPHYTVAYNLNNHPRSILVSHLLADRVIGPGAWGPVNPKLPPWAAYLCSVARHRGQNRIHLSDAFCGLCQVYPPKEIPRLLEVEEKRPSWLEPVEKSSRPNVLGLVLGAGEKERRIPLKIWQSFIQICLTSLPEIRILLLGGNAEQELGLALESELPLSSLNRVINGCGKTSMSQLVTVFNRCGWVVGSDTGPLHLSALCGARTVGWYFSRARVHETGPYGPGHWVWQYWEESLGSVVGGSQEAASKEYPRSWPLNETVQILRGNTVSPSMDNWSLWTSHRDAMGTYYVGENQDIDVEAVRNMVWEHMTEATRNRAS